MKNLEQRKIKSKNLEARILFKKSGSPKCLKKKKKYIEQNRNLLGSENLFQFNRTTRNPHKKIGQPKNVSKNNLAVKKCLEKIKKLKKAQKNSG